MIQLEDHPIAAIFPLLSEPELAELADDIKAHGMQVPIVLFEGKILDGRNRYRAAMRVGAGILSKEYDGPSAVDHVISLNLKRRQLTASQKAAVAADALPHFEAEAKGRMSKGGEGTAKLPDLEKGEAREKAAEATGASARYVQDAKNLKANHPDVFEQVRSGEVSIPRAKAEVKRRFPEPALTAEEKLEVIEAEKDSENLWSLKSYWRRAGKKDRAAFLLWTKQNS